MRLSTARAVTRQLHIGEMASRGKAIARPIASIAGCAEVHDASAIPKRSRCSQPIQRRCLATATQLSTGSSPAASAPASTDLLELYRGLVVQGRLKWDDEQVRCVIKVYHIFDILSLAVADDVPSFDIC